MTAPRPRSRQPKQLDAGILQAEISSFALRAGRRGQGRQDDPDLHRGGPVVRRHLPARAASRASWEHVDSRDIQQWMAWLLDRYSSAYASNQYRALQQFFKWLAAEDELPDPMEGLQPPRVTDKLVPVFTAGGASPAGAGLRGPQLHPAPRYRDHRGIPRDRHPAGRAGRPCGPATSTCGSGRSPSTARAARTGSSGSATRPPGAWTGTCAPAPGTGRPGGRSCG